MDGAHPVVSPVQDCVIGSIPSTSPQLHNIIPVLNMNMTGNNYIRHIGMALSGFMFFIRTLFLFRPLTARRFYFGEMRVVASFPLSLLSNIISLCARTLSIRKFCFFPLPISYFFYCPSPHTHSFRGVFALLILSRISHCIYCPPLLHFGLLQSKASGMGEGVASGWISLHGYVPEM